MARSSYLMILILFLAITRLPDTSGQQNLFTYQLLKLVLIWGPSFCLIQNCNRHTPTPMFTLHGIWPDNQTRSLCNCPGSNYEPAQVQTFVNRLDQYWFDYTLRSTPNVSRPEEQRFWAHEWRRHGTCSEMTFRQIGYFNLAVDLASRYSRLVQEAILSRVQFPASRTALLNAIRSVTNQRLPEVRCAYSRLAPTRQLLLREVVICFDPMGRNVIGCPGTNECRSCSTDSTCQQCSTNSIQLPRTF